MPTYQYQCLGCSYEFEEFQQITEDPLTVCPKCKGKIERIITGGAGLLFKGTGFYITDYKNKNSSPSNGGNGKNKVKKPVESSGSDNGKKETPSKTKKDSKK